ncbi:hypothetical protein [Planctomicrobium sp. SH664]|uniref:hypothetical protein n=1 Tax=Planctomicrobium sp. SH664 TaxID=3448125 RepID=UPI003F5C0DAF
MGEVIHSDPAIEAENLFHIVAHAWPQADRILGQANGFDIQQTIGSQSEYFELKNLSRTRFGIATMRRLLG